MNSFMKFPEMLTRLIQFETKEKINIITNNMIYSVNKSFIVGISPLFFQVIQANPMIKEIYLPISEDIDDFFQGNLKDQKL